MKEPIFTGRLTKKALNQLPEASYLASNVRDWDGEPAYAETVGPVESRQKQWQSITEADAHGRLCLAFRDEAEYRESEKEVSVKRQERRRSGKKSFALLESLLEDGPCSDNGATAQDAQGRLCSGQSGVGDVIQ